MLEHLKRNQVEELLSLLEDLPRKHRIPPAPTPTPTPAVSIAEEAEAVADENQNPLVTHLSSLEASARVELVGLVYVGKDKAITSFEEGVSVAKNLNAEGQIAALTRYGLLLENYVRAGLNRVDFR